MFKAMFAGMPPQLLHLDIAVRKGSNFEEADSTFTDRSQPSQFLAWPVFKDAIASGIISSWFQYFKTFKTFTSPMVQKR
jgi:hypothetical protein